MHIEPITTGAFQEICYLAWNNERRALVFDPGHDAELILQCIERNQLQVEAYVCTHGHADHVNALAAVHEQHPARIAMHTLDWAWAFDSRNQIEPYYPVPHRPAVETALALEHVGTDWQVDGFEFQCIETPGHTPGSCCLLFPDSNTLIAGDTLFRGSCGRTDLPGGDPRKLKESLNKLKQLPDDVRVYPGHGPSTTIGIERATNLYMQ